MIGTIENFEGSWASGLGFLTIKDAEDGRSRRIACDNGPTVRALSAMFPGVILPGQMVNNRALRGKEVQYGLGDGGLVLGWLALPEGAIEEEEEEEL